MILFCRIRNDPRDALRETLLHFLKVVAGIQLKDTLNALCAKPPVERGCVFLHPTHDGAPRIFLSVTERQVDPVGRSRYLMGRGVIQKSRKPE